MARKGPKLSGKSAPDVKDFLNRAIRDEIKNPKTPAGRAISDALGKLFPGLPPARLFKAPTHLRPTTPVPTLLRGLAKLLSMYGL
jgi:hypothetical protein